MPEIVKQTGLSDRAVREMTRKYQATLRWLDKPRNPRRPLSVSMARASLARVLRDQGLTLRQIAQTLGVAHSTVKIDLRRAQKADGPARVERGR